MGVGGALVGGCGSLVVGSGVGGTGLPGNWKPVSDVEGGAKVFIQTGSKMNDLPEDEDTPF